LRSPNSHQADRTRAALLNCCERADDTLVKMWHDR
jgi:hypothetical protein